MHAPSPFEHYQIESGHDESESWKTSNKTVYRDEQPKRGVGLVAHRLHNNLNIHIIYALITCY
jgi:hypothetical protein